jgi:hypothetical protein
LWQRLYCVQSPKNLPSGPLTNFRNDPWKYTLLSCTLRKSLPPWQSPTYIHNPIIISSSSGSGSIIIVVVIRILRGEDDGNMTHISIWRQNQTLFERGGKKKKGNTMEGVNVFTLYSHMQEITTKKSPCIINVWYMKNKINFLEKKKFPHKHSKDCTGFVTCSLG